jgi:ribosomal protein L18
MTTASRTILGVSTLAEELRAFKGESRTPKIDAAFEAGKLLARRPGSPVSRGSSSIVAATSTMAG